jgi:uncharacterized protein YjiS (DUF1127 family)
MSYRTSTSIGTYRPGAAAQEWRIGNDPRRLIRGLLGALGCWYQRSRQRTALGALDDRLLDDVGLDRDDVEREVRKPFWRG